MSRPAQGGQALILFTMFLAFVFSVLLFALADYAQLSSVYHALDTASQMGATSGAADIDQDAFRANQPLQLSPTALSSCTTSARQQLSLAHVAVGSPSVQCTNQGVTVTARVSTSIHVMFGSIGPSFPVSSVRSAQSAFGQSRPLPFP